VNDHASRTKVESKGCHAVVGDQGGEKHRDSAACPMCDPKPARDTTGNLESDR
jgi:hypothetical protein